MTKPQINLHNQDCIKDMAAMGDNAYDLAIVDPPYGLGATEEQGFGDKRLKRKSKEGKWGNKTWDDNRPPKNYFNELIRVTKNQIVFGANYYTDFLPVSKGWVIWDKVQRVDQSDTELIWTSFDSANRIFQFHRSKLQGFQNPDRFHPTQKPIQLYKWLLKNYASEGDRILDTHLGSGSIAIACHDLGFDLEGYEIDQEYHQAALERLNTHRSQLQIF